jgi:hypothetical protein
VASLEVVSPIFDAAEERVGKHANTEPGGSTGRSANLFLGNPLQSRPPGSFHVGPDRSSRPFFLPYLLNCREEVFCELRVQGRQSQRRNVSRSISAVGEPFSPSGVAYVRHPSA